MTKQELIQNIYSELRRQADMNRHESPWVGDMDEDDLVFVTVDGRVSLGELADAILKVKL